jgi:CRISPR-associated protein Cas2
MWLMAMFDLPVKSKDDRRAYTRFRHALIRSGFAMLQFSVYARFLPSEEASAIYRKIVHAALPPGGEVRLMAITDHQYGKMEIYFGKKRKPVESPPDQLGLF